MNGPSTRQARPQARAQPRHRSGRDDQDRRATARASTQREVIALRYRPREIDLPSLRDRRVKLRPLRDADAADDTAGAIDVTHTMIAAIAQELHEKYGGNDVLNWLEAERMVEHALATMKHEPAD